MTKWKTPDPKDYKVVESGSNSMLKEIYGHRWSLLVGVNRYEDSAISNLKVCTGDVRAIYDLLISNDYEPDHMRLLLAPGEPNYPPTRVEILSALTSIAQAADESDMLLFYFSGHGIFHDGKTYILPADTRYTTIADTAIDLNRVKQIIQESAARARVIILDACHSGAQIGKAPLEMTKEFIHHVFEEAERMAILASCKQKQVSWEWPEKSQSVFTHYLLDGLQGAADFDEKGFVTVSDVSRYVTDKVKTWTVQHSRIQTPTLRYNVVGDIVLATHSSATNLESLESGSTLIITAQTVGSDKTGVVQPLSSVPQPVEKTSAQREQEQTVSIITWLHLSDLHFRVSQTYNSNIVLKALLRDVTERIHDDNLQPDFAIISGDVAFASRPEEYDLARKFLDDLLKTTGLSKDRLFLIPGNHDVDRSVITPFIAGVTAILNNRDTVNSFLANDGERALVFQRFHNYRDFINKYFGKRRFPFDDAHYSYVKQIDVASLRVAVLGLNSAWLAASDKDRNRLLLGERQIRDALKAAQGANLRLAVMHHPFDWLQDFDRGNVESLLCGKCDYVLHGHMHQVDLLQARTPDSATMVIAAGACYETREYLNSYNFVQLNLSTCKGTIYWRTYSDREEGFWAPDVMNYRSAPDGKYSFPLPEHLCSANIEEKREEKKKKKLFGTEPFIHHCPVGPKDFVGRESELSTIFNRLRNCESTLVVGEPHIGKTSLLLNLTDKNTQQTYLGSDAQDLLVVLLDLHHVGNDYTQGDFWTDALYPLRERPDYLSSMPDWPGLIVQTGGATRRHMERIFNRLHSEGQRLVLLLDEFERLLIHPNFQDNTFFALLHTLSTHTGGLALVSASRLSVAEMNRRGRVLLDVGSPFFKHMINVRLRPFDERVVEKLLNRAGDTLSPDDRRFIRRIAGRHPFLLQAMAAALFETDGEDRHARAAARFYERITFHFDDLWCLLNDRTHTTAIVLGLVEWGSRALGQDFAYNEIERVDAFGPELRKLEKRGLAKHVSDDGRFDQRHLFLWRGERWTVESQAFIWWIRDVVVTKSRSIPAYDKWLGNRAYRSLLTREQWDWLVSAVRNAPEWARQGVRGMAQALFEELTGRTSE